jgi:hypothetical protein
MRIGNMHILKIFQIITTIAFVLFLLNNCGDEKGNKSQSAEPTFSYLWDKSFKTCTGCHTGKEGGDKPVLASKEDFLNHVDERIGVGVHSGCGDLNFINTDESKKSLLVQTITKYGENNNSDQACEGGSQYQIHTTYNKGILDEKDTQMLIQWIEEGAKDN